METKTVLIQWRDSFETGYKRVDAQHKYLVNLINEMYRNQIEMNPVSKLDYIFTELFKYTVNHFSMEEMIMREYEYDNYEMHKLEHTQFISKICELKDKYLEGSEGVKIEILNFLKSWLLKHIIGTDKGTFANINRKIN